MRTQQVVIGGLLLLAVVFAGLLHLIGLDAATPAAARSTHGIARMATGLLVIWVLLGGACMVLARHRIRRMVRAIPLDERLKFTIFAILLAGLEEVVTVSMTNLAPLFGAAEGEAYITASANYFDVILFHSVVVFIPYFIVLALILHRWAFSPFVVFLSFGVVGTACEAIFAGNPGVFVSFPIWAFVYGLMVWLPTFCMDNRTARPVGSAASLLLAPAVFLLALPMIAAIAWVITVALGHPGMHFG